MDEVEKIKKETLWLLTEFKKLMKEMEEVKTDVKYLETVTHPSIKLRGLTREG